MAPIPKPTPRTSAAIYDAYAAREAERGSWEGLGISISILGEECERQLWYEFRWASPAEVITGLKAIVFETGRIEEDRLLDSLEMIGCEVQRVDPATGKQFRYSAAHGHIRGKSDGKALGLPEAPKTWHKVECKSSKQEYFKPIVKDGVKKGYYSHYVQATTYGYLGGLDRVLYMCRNKNTGEIHTERLEVDPAETIRLLARGERIVFMAEPPARLFEDVDAKMAWKCRSMCRHRRACHEKAFSRVNCRTCVHASPMTHGDAEWSCARWNKPLSADEQRAGCPAHLFIPALVPGEVIEVDEEAATIRYALADGREWVDGDGNAPDEVASPGDEASTQQTES